MEVSGCIHRLLADQPEVLADLVSADLPQWAVVMLIVLIESQ